MTQKFKSDFLHILHTRGFIHQISDPDALDLLYSKREPIPAYIGFDATAKSLHAGSLIQIMMLYWLQQTGHKPIILMGGGTSLIGDPSFRDEARKMLTEEEISCNIQEIKKNFIPYVSFGDDPTDAMILNNIDWLLSLNYLDFLRTTGKHFSVNRMLSFESVKLRLDRQQSLSFLEFNYMILQAYDFVELFKQYDCRLQMGGSDQWGNIINGIELAHKKENVDLFALTSPLLTNAAGAKMGKSGSQTVWLNAEMCPPYIFWQYWRNTEDSDVIKFLKLYTTIPLEEIAYLAKLKGSDINQAKKILATEVTSLLHGKEEAKKCAESAEKLFEQNIFSNDLPCMHIQETEFEHGIGILKLLVQVGFAQSHSQARRNIQEKSIRLNGDCIIDAEMIVTKEHFQHKEHLNLSLGKKRHILVYSTKE